MYNYSLFFLIIQRPLLRITLNTFLFSVYLVSVSSCCHGQELELQKEIVYLADSIGCRYPGSEGDIKARDHILDKFTEYGLKGEVQTFDIVEKIWGEGSLRLTGRDGSLDLCYGDEFVVNPRSATDTLSAGYVTVTGSLPDSLHHIMKGKVVLCVQDTSAAVAGSRITSVSAASEAGARAMIYVHKPDMRVRHSISNGNRHYLPWPIPVLTVNYDMLREFIPGRTVHIATKHHEKHLEAANIIGLKRGSISKTVIIGAHFDTLKPDPDSGMVRPGANDNASGVAVLLALAERLSVIETRCNIIFVAFGGEEKGALGSMNFVQHYPISRESIEEMINLDMVGGMADRTLYFRQFNATRVIPSSTRIHLVEGEDARSDHGDFVSSGVPATYFTTGQDEKMHTIYDTSDGLNYEGMKKIVAFLVDYILRIAA